MSQKYETADEIRELRTNLTRLAAENDFVRRENATFTEEIARLRQRIADLEAFRQLDIDANLQWQAEARHIVEEMKAACDPSVTLQKVTFNQLVLWIDALSGGEQKP